MNRRRLYSLAAAVTSTAAALLPQARAQLKAFPEAEGFGRFATGARTNLASASVYHVTNLNDAGAGSFRDAVSQPNRFVVFDVSGVIRLTTGVVPVSANVTIAGQTAPGGGITLYGDRLSYTSASNSISRYLRVRKGSVSDRSDALSLARGSNMIFDHMSVTWGNDETFSMNPDSGFQIDNITIQNTIIGQGLDNVNHSAGGLMTIGEGNRFSVLRSLFIDNETRNPKARGENQFVNNVTYNWTTAAYIMGDTSAVSHANVVGNYFVRGPNGNTNPFSSGSPSFFIYAENNLYDGDRDGSLDGTLITSFPGSTVVPTPHDFPAVGIHSPEQAYQRVVDQVGPSIYRDVVDNRMIEELTSLGTLGQIVIRENEAGNSPYSNYPSAYPIPTAPKPTDTDNDGIPDTWELARGLSPTDATDWRTIGPTGYTRLEEYFNDIEALSANANFHPDKTWTANSGTWPTSVNWTGGAPTFDDDAFVRGNGAGVSGNLTITAPGAAAFRLSIGGNGNAAGESLTVASGGSLSVGDLIAVGDQNHATLTINAGATVESTNVFLGNVVAGTTYTGTLNLTGGTLKTNRLLTTGNAVFNWDGGTLAPSHGPAIYTAHATLGPAGATFDSAGLASTYAGNLTGSSSLTKIGAGSLDLTGNNALAGVVLSAGSLGIASDANLGGPAVPLTFSGGLLRINGSSLTTLGSHPVNFATFNGGFDIASSGNTFTVAQSIGGTGSLTKAGAGTLVLSGNNAHTGGTIVQGGVLSVSTDANLGAPGNPLSLDGGSLRITGTAIANLDNHPIVSANGAAIDVATSTHVFTLNQVVPGNGSFGKSGPGTLVLPNPDFYAGALNVIAGTVRIGHPHALRQTTVNLTGSGATLDLNGATPTFGGLMGNQPFDLKGGAAVVGFNNASTTYSGVLSSSLPGGAVRKVGTGTLTLTGNSTLAGPVTLATGTVAVSNVTNYNAAGPLGQASSAAALVLDGGTLRFTGGSDSTDRLFALGPAGGTIDGAGSGGLTLSSTAAVEFVGAGNRTLTLQGTNQSNGFSFALADPPLGGKTSLRVAGSARWILSGTAPRTYTGDTVVANSATLLALNSHDSLPFGPGKGNLWMDGGVFEMNGFNLSINGLRGDANVNNRSNSRTLTLGHGDVSQTFVGTLTNSPLSGSSTLHLAKVGAGIQVLTGANTYTGATTVNAGVLQFNAANSLGGSGATLLVNAAGAAATGYAMDQTFLNRVNTTSTGTLALAAASSNALNLTSLPNVTLGAVGSVTHSGVLTAGTTYRLGGNTTGTLTLNATNALSGSRSLLVTGAAATIALANSNNYTGPTTVAPGATLAISTPAALGTSPNDPANLTIDGGTLRFSATQTLDRSLTITPSGAAISTTTTAAPTLNGNIVSSGTGDRTLTLFADGSATSNTNLNASITDPATGKLSFVKSGPARAWFNSPKTYSGDTSVSAGTLQMGAPDALPFGPGKGNLHIAAGASLHLFNNNTQINGLFGAGTLQHGGTNTRSLTLGHNDATASFAGSIAGTSAFSVIKTGAGAQTFSGNNTYAGPTVVQQGALHLAASLTTSSTLTVSPGASVLLTPGGDKAIKLTTLSLTGSAQLDLTDNSLILDYADGAPTPLDSLRQLLATAATPDLTWTGPGLTSSAARGFATHQLPGPMTSLGLAEAATYKSRTGTTSIANQPLDDSAVVITYTYTGDATLDGQVTDADVDVLIANYNTATADWSKADFTHDGTVDDLDLDLLTASLGYPNHPALSVTPAALARLHSLRAPTPIPEPTTALMASAVACLIATRRRNRRPSHPRPGLH